jgi:hypothetical protein
LAAIDHKGHVAKRWDTPWSVTGIQPDRPPTELSARLDLRGLPDGRYQLALRVVNPLPGGNDLRFANTSQDVRTGWLGLGPLAVR